MKNKKVPAALDPRGVALIEFLVGDSRAKPSGLFRVVNGQPEVTYKGKLVIDAVYEALPRRGR